jgi:hypothetical protein
MMNRNAEPNGLVPPLVRGTIQTIQYFTIAASRLGELNVAQENYRDKHGEFSRRYGNILIGTLRSHYGSHFAPRFAESDRLTDVLDDLDGASLDSLTRDYESGKLSEIFPD